MANRKQKTSPSDLSERTVVAGAVSAMVTGANGHALAAIIIKDALAIGELAQKQAMSRKDRLSALLALDGESVDAFIADMVARQKEINEEAKVVPNRSLMDYLIDNPKENSVYAETSMWLGIARAVKAGWKPMNDKKEPITNQADWPEWRLLTMQASAVRNSTGASNDPSNPQKVPSGKKGKGKGRPEVPTEKKAANAALGALKDKNGKALPKNNRNLSEVVRIMLSDATVQELVEVAAVVQNQLAIAQKAEEEAAKLLAGANAGSKPAPEVQNGGEQTQQTTAGATVKHTPARRTGKGKNVPEGTVNTPNLAEQARAISKAS
jgi:hypothetical protein